ncbi:MAG: hypothetical protein HY271_06260 [Deltaproteobacteria bacterium]|nr:hypothetical protein [Deltaproteobacteria bacterium]
MANILCPWCGCPIAVDRGIRRHGVVYCCRGCATWIACELPGCARTARHAAHPPDVSLPETRDRPAAQREARQ